jgi:hypothetical protein
MDDAIASPACISMATDPERLYALREASKLLEEVQRGLAAYLEKKRLYFPRWVGIVPLRHRTYNSDILVTSAFHQIHLLVKRPPTRPKCRKDPNRH